MSMNTSIALAVHSCLLLHASAGSAMQGSNETFKHCKDLESGPQLPKFSDGKPPINEPCYEHVGICAGYAVCCVKYGTCKSLGGMTLSSNLAYYVGGCQSLNSSKKAWDKPENQGCTEQGECLAAYILTNKGGYATSRNGVSLMTDVPADHLARVMVGSTWNGNTCPDPNAPQTTTGTQASVAGNVLPMLCTAIVCLLVQFQP